MAVKVDNTDGTVVAVDGTEKRESNGVVTSESDQARQCGSLLGWAGLVGMSVWCAAKEKVVAFLNLLERKRVVVPRIWSVLSFLIAVTSQCLRSDWDVSAINDLCP